MNNKATILPFLLERINDKNPDEVIVFNLIEQAMLDHLVLVLVNNTRKLNAIKDELRKSLLKTHLERLHHIEGQYESGWVVVDAFEVVVHILSFEAEEKYKLKELFQTKSKN
jgi:ribosome-associated protein